MKHDEPKCDFGCESHLGQYYPDCPKHNPIDVELHDAILLTQEPIRAELRIANTSEALRKRILVASNGHTTHQDLSFLGSFDPKDHYY